MTLKVTCPHCGFTSDVDELFVRLDISCPQCSEVITIPRSDTVSTPSNSYSSGKTRISKKVILIISVIVTLLALLGGGIIIIAYITSQRINQRMICLNNQKQVALALINYESEHGRFPPVYTTDKNGKPLHSWRVLILPQLGRMDLYKQFNLDEPWNSPRNLPLAEKMPKVYGCPASPNSPNCTAYAMLVGPQTVNRGFNFRTTLTYILSKDGCEKTLLLVEATKAKINWTEPRDLNVEEMTFQINKDNKEISSYHSGCAVVSFCDGHQALLREDIKPETLKALTSVDGGEKVDENENR